MAKYSEELRDKPFENYNEYMQYIFDCVNTCLDKYIDHMKVIYSQGDGNGYKNVLYPDIEVAGDSVHTKLESFYSDEEEQAESDDDEEIETEDDDESDVDDELLELLSSFSNNNVDSAVTVENEDDNVSGKISADNNVGVYDRIIMIENRAEHTSEKGIKLPFHELCKKLEFEPFTLFCFACGILSSTQTDYAGVFQIVNENGNLSAPTIESAAKIFYGNQFSITGAYGDMSTCLEQLLPILSLEVIPSMPFSTAVSPDKRIIDFLFGRNPDKLDENYIRFFSMLTKNEELNPIMANSGILEAMEISYDEGCRIFYYYGDDGSGRKFFVKKFCESNGLKAVAINCKKLFNYDFRFVEKAL